MSWVIRLPLFSVPVIWTHGTCKNNFPGKFSVSFPQEISCIFHSALPDQLRNQPEVSRSYQIAQASFYQTDSLSLRRYSFKNFRMLCLGYSQIEVSVKLLPSGIIMGMIHSRICRINYCIAILNHCSGIDHISSPALRKLAFDVSPAVRRCVTSEPAGFTNEERIAFYGNDPERLIEYVDNLEELPATTDFIRSVLADSDPTVVLHATRKIEDLIAQAIEDAEDFGDDDDEEDEGEDEE